MCVFPWLVETCVSSYSDPELHHCGFCPLLAYHSLCKADQDCHLLRDLASFSAMPDTPNRPRRTRSTSSTDTPCTLAQHCVMHMLCWLHVLSKQRCRACSWGCVSMLL